MLILTKNNCCTIKIQVKNTMTRQDIFFTKFYSLLTKSCRTLNYYLLIITFIMLSIAINFPDFLGLFYFLFFSASLRLTGNLIEAKCFSMSNNFL